LPVGALACAEKKLAIIGSVKPKAIVAGSSNRKLNMARADVCQTIDELLNQGAIDDDSDAVNNKGTTNAQAATTISAIAYPNSGETRDDHFAPSKYPIAIPAK